MGEKRLWPSEPLPPELVAKAEAELNEIESEREEKIRALREAVLNVPDLKSRTDDQFLLRFLRARKFRLEDSLHLVKSYYQQRTKYPDLYKRLQSASISNLMKVNLMLMAPGRSKKGCAICVFNGAELWNPSEVPLDELILEVVLTMERLIQAEDVQINGMTTIVDLRGFGLRHLLATAHPYKMAKIFSVTQNGFPIRFKEFHFVNNPRIFNFLCRIMRPFMSKKFQDRFVFHGNKVSNLLDYFDPDVLPEVYGGSGEPFDNGLWNQELLNNDEEVSKYKDFGFASP